MSEATSSDFDKSASRDSKVAEFHDERRGILTHIQHFLHQTPAAVPLIVLILSIAVFGVLLGSKFFSPFALTLILQQVAIVGITAAAQSLVILTAGIDLSVGAIMVFSSVLMGQLTFRYGIPAEISIGLGLAAAGAPERLNAERTIAAWCVRDRMLGAAFLLGGTREEIV